MVSYLIDNEKWDSSKIIDWCSKELQNNITNINLISSPSTDRWSWKEGTNDLSLTKAIYNTLPMDRSPINDNLRGWKILWNLHIAPKIKVFI